MPAKKTRSRRVNLYGVSVLATASALALPPSAEAEVLRYSSGLTTVGGAGTAEKNGDIFFSFSSGLSSLTVPNSGYDYRLSHDTTGAISSIFGNGSNQTAQAIICGPTNLAAGDTIDATRTYSQGSQLTLNWGPPAQGYLGLKFQLPSSATHYGWADISIAANRDITLNEFGYETTPDTGILAGSPNLNANAPEPSPLALLVLGVPALALYRHRQQPA